MYYKVNRTKFKSVITSSSFLFRVKKWDIEHIDNLNDWTQFFSPFFNFIINMIAFIKTRNRSIELFFCYLHF